MKKFTIYTLALLSMAMVQAAAQTPFDEILFIERAQYAPDHHNTETLFQFGEINPEKFDGGSAMKALNVQTGAVRTIISSENGVVRDPELSFDGRRIIFSMRPSREECYHIYEIDTDGNNLRQLTFAKGVSDIDPLYLPDGGIMFSATREPKYCMCNRHIMCNMYRMDADGANITQIGKSTLFEGHSSLLNDGRVLYDRWEYIDRNFGDAQGLWTVNPDGTKHAIYYGNNTPSPGGVIDGRAIPGSDLVICVFGACHDRPWGALALIDRKKGVDGPEPVVQIWPSEAMKHVGPYDFDRMMQIPVRYEDPYPLDKETFLVSKSQRWDTTMRDFKMAIYRVDRSGAEQLLYEAPGRLGAFDPMPIAPRFKPGVIPFARDYATQKGLFYVQNVYEGTNMQGVEPGSVKYLRVVESPEKRTWTRAGWGGQGEQAPAMNWHSFENKRILGEVPVAEDGSAYFEAPAGSYVFFQLLDKDRRMVQSMRSGTMVHSGEVNGCVGCHENRLSIPIPKGNTPTALRSAPAVLNGWMGREPRTFSFARDVQPILDAKCVKCHDFDTENRDKLVLAGDRNPFFNAAYVNLYVMKKVKLVGGGPADIQQPYSWGAHASILGQVVAGKHNGVKLSADQKHTIDTWMDMNGVYYPEYEAFYGDNMAGRSPLNGEEINELSKLTGVNFRGLNNHGRGMTAQVSFERPALSPCLDGIRADKPKYDRAVEIIALGGKRLREHPRADMKGFEPSPEHQDQLRKYADFLDREIANNKAVADGAKRYDK